MNARPMTAHEAEAVIQESRRAERKVIEEAIAVTCAWCEPDAKAAEGEVLSHGICPQHEAEFDEEARVAEEQARRVAQRMAPTTPVTNWTFPSEPRTLASDMSEDR